MTQWMTAHAAATELK